MQLTAYLKDSYREARSGWVLQTMFILLFLVLLVLASISFTPTTVADTAFRPFSYIRRSVHLNPQFQTIQIAIENEQVSNPSEPWKSRHAFDLVMSADTAESLKKFRDEPGMPTTKGAIRSTIRSVVPFLIKPEVTETKAADGKSVRFHVASEGTTLADVTAWPHVPTAFFVWEMPLFTSSLRELVFGLQKYVMSGMGAMILLFVSVIISSGFIPNMMQKGAFDLAVTKPIARWRLLVYKYLGGLVFVAVLTTAAVVGSYLVIGLRSGLWNHGYLWAVPCIVAYFAVLYAVSTLAAVLTRSAIVAILAALLAWVFLFGLGKLNNRIDTRKAMERQPAELRLPTPGEDIDPDTILATIDPDAPVWGFIPKSSFGIVQGIARVAPRTYQIDDRLSRLIAHGVLTPDELKRDHYSADYPYSWAEIISVTLAFIAVVLGLACWRFSTRDG